MRKILDGTMAAAATIDRVARHGHPIVFEGEPCRLGHAPTRAGGGDGDLVKLGNSPS